MEDDTLEVEMVITGVEWIACPSRHPYWPMLRCRKHLAHQLAHEDPNCPGTLWFDIDPAANPELANEQQRAMDRD